MTMTDYGPEAEGWRYQITQQWMEGWLPPFRFARKRQRSHQAAIPASELGTRAL